MSGPTATATAPAAATSPYAAGRRSVAKFPATRATIAGRIRAAPTPSRNDQPNNSTGRFGAIAVVKEPQPYTTQPIANARLRPMSAPTFAPVIISAAITSVYAVIAPWMPVTVVPTSLATVAIETFMTELSSVIRNWPDASVKRTRVAPVVRAARALATVLTTEALSRRTPAARTRRPPWTGAAGRPSTPSARARSTSHEV